MLYLASNANNRIPIATQIIMWYLLDRMKAEKDYLQIFKLSVQDGKQKILHTQEQLQWSEEILYTTDAPITEKVYIIKENDYEIMLLQKIINKKSKCSKNVRNAPKTSKSAKGSETHI